MITPARDVEGEGCGASEVRRRIRAVSDAHFAFISTQIKDQAAA